jgi:hypothetical protein
MREKVASFVKIPREGYMKDVDRLCNELVSQSGRGTCARIHPRKQRILFLNLYHFRPPSIQLPTDKVEEMHEENAKANCFARFG